jgi:Ca-activated chloride channel family protein
VSFDHPQILTALLLLIPFALGMLLQSGKHRGVLALFPAADRARGLPSWKQVSWKQVSLGGLRQRYWLSAIFFLVFLGCSVIALAGPRWGFRLVPEFRRGVDVVLAIDLSRSMEVRDGGTDASGGAGALTEGRPSRLERAAAIAGEVVSAGMMGDGRDRSRHSPDIAGIRYAAAIGKGAGILAIPLTSDLEAVLTFLEGLSPFTVTGRGTNLENLVDAAAGAFKDAFPGKRRIILFSDGESLQGNFASAVDRALAADIAITAVGLGTGTGGIVPWKSGMEGLESLSPQGRSSAQGDQSPITSFLRRDTLQNAAGRTGGIYLDGSRDDAAEKLAEHLASLSFETRSGAFRREVRSQRHIFILAALAALGLSKLLEKKRRRRHEST